MTRQSKAVDLGSLLVASCAAVALAACGSQSSASETADAAEQVPAMAAQGSGAAPAVTLSAADRAAAFRAAGGTQRGGKWMASCDEEDSGTSYELDAEFKDLNGDGSPEAVVAGGNSACHGMTGTGFVVFTRKAAKWQTLTESMGIPVFYEREGIAWPDIEIGGPGSNCFRFLRWNGTAYVDGGTSLGGRICELAPAFAGQSAQASSSSAPVPPLGIAAGYYVPERESCNDPIEVIYYDGRRFAYMLPGIAGPESIGPLGAVSRDGRSLYLEDWAALVDVIGPTRIQIEIQDASQPMRLCPTAQIPAGLRVR